MKIKNKTSNLFFVIVLFVIIIITTSKELRMPAEELDLPAGLGLDLTTDKKGELMLKIPISIYDFSGDEQKTKSYIRTGTGKTIGETRNSRALKSNHKFRFGSEKIYIFSESFAESFMRIPLDSLFRNTEVNDMGYAVVCKGNSLPILEYNVEGYPSSSDYLGSMIDNSKIHNFFSDDYKLIDIFTRIDSEGRSLVLPYIELKENGLEITGMALFKKDKMVRKIDMDEARIMNMLRADNTWGILYLKKSLKQYSDMFANSKRKVKCYKENDNYSFIIDINIEGELFTNELYKNLSTDLDEKKKYEDNMAKELEHICSEFIKKMQEEYCIDCLELGRIAAAKYGRNTRVDWNEVICSSDIKVNVKVNLARFGRGDF